METPADQQVNIPGSGVNQAPGGKNLLIAVMVVLVVVIVTVAVYLALKSIGTKPAAPGVPTTQGEDVPEIKSDADFGKLESELKNTDVNSLSKDLDQNDKEAADL